MSGPRIVPEQQLYVNDFYSKVNTVPPVTLNKKSLNTTTVTSTHRARLQFVTDGAKEFNELSFFFNHALVSELILIEILLDVTRNFNRLEVQSGLSAVYSNAKERKVFIIFLYLLF